MNSADITLSYFSECRRYRYRLGRIWSMFNKRFVLWVMLNPSTADEIKNDPTMNRCINFSKAWGYDGLMVGNLYAWRSTDPAALWKADDPIGCENDAHIAEMASQASMIVCAWGGKGKSQRVAEVMQMLKAVMPVHALKINDDGSPGHPLYLKEELQPFLYQPQLEKAS